MLRWGALDDTGALDAVVTTRHGGVSGGGWASLNLALHVGDDPGAVVRNRRRAAGAIGASIDALVVAEQIHGCAVTVVDAADAGRGARSADDAIPGTDALVTTSPAVALVVLVADCVPLVIVDPHAGVLAVVHAGWRGTAAGVTAAAVGAMEALGARRDRLVVGIGPAANPATYEVGEEVAGALTAALGDVDDDPAGAPDSATVLTPAGPHRWTCDLVAANVALLGHAGVRRASIHAMATTTSDPDLFSHRRGTQGRFAALARLRPAVQR